MKREGVIGLFGVLFILMLVVALFHNDGNVPDAGQNIQNVFREITPFNQAAQPAAFAPAANATVYPQYPQQGPGNCPVYPQNAPGFYPQYPQAQAAMAQQIAAQQAAVTNVQNAQTGPAIEAGQDKPVLIKLFGCEVIPVGGGKVRITGVMGNSWADKAGLKAGDILLSFDRKKITSLEQFQSILAAAAPEQSYKVTFMRGSRIKKCIISIGEGEMEGFLPIPQPKP